VSKNAEAALLTLTCHLIPCTHCLLDDSTTFEMNVCSSLCPVFILQLRFATAALPSQLIPATSEQRVLTS